MLKSNPSRLGGDRKIKDIYVDYAASASPNPSSIHKSGLNAKKKMEKARREVADVLKVRREEIIFTSGGTESNNLAIQGVVFAWHEENKNINKILPHIITTNIEHPSVLETYKLLEKRNLAQISIIPVEKNGIVDPKKIKKEIRSNTILVSVMYANNEIGTIQPIREIAKEIRHYQKQVSKDKSIFPFFHTDAVQAVNYLDLSIANLHVDLLSLSGSKIEGAGRIGILYKYKSIKLAPVFGGGDQEQGIRPGTENLPEIIKFSNAFVLAQNIREKEVKRLTVLRDYFLKKLKLHTSDVKNPDVGRMNLNGDLTNRLPNNINITISQIPSDLMIIELSEKRIMASSKSACKSSRAEGSYVIKAIHPEADLEIGGIRFSLGKETTRKDIDYIIKSLSEILKKLKKWYN